MSQWCNTCSLSKVTGEWQSCGYDCPAFGKSFEELAEIVIKQREEVDALRWTNKQLIKVGKEKRKELWKKAINEFAEKLRKKKSDLFLCGVFFGIVTVDDIDNIKTEMIKHIKE